MNKGRIFSEVEGAPELQSNNINFSRRSHAELICCAKIPKGIRKFSSKPVLTCVGEASTPASLRTKKSLNP
jgi:hypothetical protein